MIKSMLLKEPYYFNLIAVKKEILGIKLKEQSFDNRHSEYRQFLNEFDSGLHNMVKFG
jgi:hypothetical protein